jgi:hypothetical protein
MDAVGYLRKVQKEKDSEEVSIFGAIGVKQPIQAKLVPAPTHSTSSLKGFAKPHQGLKVIASLWIGLVGLETDCFSLVGLTLF